MPRGDRTGPEGLGPQTGRAAGHCAGSPAPGYMNAGGASGFGRGRGGHGHGRRNRFLATGLPGWMRWGAPAPDATPTQEQADEPGALRTLVQRLQAELKSLQARISQLEPERTSERADPNS